MVPAVIYEVTGSAAGLHLALDTAQPGTRIVLVGIQSDSTEVEFRRITLEEVELIGTNAHAFALDFPEALRLLASRADGWADIAPVAVPLDKLVDDGLVPIVEGRARRIKTLIDPWSDITRVTS
jgi:(R,R)-butanediol dehydrogenase/meso-butanediol dehydrogenase/diacetyl reductase